MLCGRSQHCWPNTSASEAYGFASRLPPTDPPTHPFFPLKNNHPMTPAISRRAALTLTTAILAGTAGRAQQPASTIKFVAPFPAGGSTDILPRLVAGRSRSDYSGGVVIENKTGAGGDIGGEHVASGDADGTTFLVSPPRPIAINDQCGPQWPWLRRPRAGALGSDRPSPSERRTAWPDARHWPGSSACRPRSARPGQSAQAGANACSQHHQGPPCQYDLRHLPLRNQ